MNHYQSNYNLHHQHQHPTINNNNQHHPKTTNTNNNSIINNNNNHNNGMDYHAPSTSPTPTFTTTKQKQRRQSRGFTVPDQHHHHSTISNKNKNNNDEIEEQMNNIDYQNENDDQDSNDNDYVSNTQKLESLKEWNQIITWMNHEFWEQSEDIYQEKLAALHQELKSLQDDTHVVFRDLVSDLDLKRETMIADAESFLNYQLEWMEQLYHEDIALIEEEYNNERRHLHDALISVIEDRKKQVREEKDDTINIKDLFSEAYSRVTNKRTLRKRPADTSRSEPRKRQARNASSQNTENQIQSKEEEELEEEFLLMKAGKKSSLISQHKQSNQSSQQKR
ncbi:hypothetical protein BJ944DRAFT_262474 [Cunninghamella echinulata]|nr:hypothetical protein BJ944DRAFT_262474 [Cunninghamella echinulata]